jgi:hypothetical protein
VNLLPPPANSIAHWSDVWPLRTSCFDMTGTTGCDGIPFATIRNHCAQRESDFQGEQHMKSSFQARWLSKKQAESLRKSGRLGRALLLDSFKGFIVIEPRAERLGDGDVLSPEEADFELNDAWCMESTVKIAQARRLLGAVRKLV